MDSTPIRRWNPGFIALRWRHGFWGLPLLGLLAGLVVHFLPMIGTAATGVVQLRPIRSSPSGLPLIGPSDVDPIIRSDQLLRHTVLALDLPRRWQMDSQDCVTELRAGIHFETIPGTALAEITVSGRGREESRLIWETLVTALSEHFNRIGSAQDQIKMDQLEADLERQKADVEAKRQALTKALQPQDLLLRPNSPAPMTADEVKYLRDDFETSQRLLDRLQIQVVTEKMRQKISEDPLIIHQAPGTPAPVTLWDTLRPLVLHSSIGLGSGMVLAVVVAYLLELLFPRKVPSL